jgi:hypothetical protein
MDEVRTQPDPWGSSQGRDNTSLGARFIQELLDQPDDSQPIPLGATVILMPPVDEPDPELAAANMRRAEELVSEGRTVILWTVGQEPPYTTVPEVTSLSTTADS